jgi:ABC-type branched-subunit amino acid transport system ATPase component
VIELGSVVSEGTPERLRSDSTLLEAYLGRAKANVAPVVRTQ